MAEVRKFKTGQRNQVSEAIARAMGEGVRPATPGAPPQPGDKRPAKPAATNITAISSASFQTVAGFTTSEAHRPRRGRDEQSLDSEER